MDFPAEALRRITNSVIDARVLGGKELALILNGIVDGLDEDSFSPERVKQIISTSLEQYELMQLRRKT